MMSNKLVHAESSQVIMQKFDESMKEKEKSVVNLIEKLRDTFDLGDKVKTIIGFDVYKYIEEIDDYETLFIPKGTVGEIESSGWNMSNNFNTMFYITLFIDNNEIEYCVKEDDIDKYFSRL